jgi:hypothetical protein
MSPPKDPFRPSSDASFSKGEVNRAGEWLEAFYFRPPGIGPNILDSADIE